MNSIMRVLPALLLFISCQSGSEQEDELRNLRHTIAAFYKAVEEGDFYQRIGLFADDVLILPNNALPVRGKETVKNRWEPYKDAVFRIRDLETVALKRDGGIAYTVNTYSYTYHNQGEEPVWHKTKNVHIWEKQEDGSWRLRVDIWNSSGR